MSEVFTGLRTPGDSTSEYNRLAFVFKALMGKTSTAALVQIVAVTNTDGVEPVGLCDVHPMVAMVDGNGDATPHGTIFGVPYLRVQGGKNAIIMDPKVGDIGIAVFASHDISSAKANKASSNPGSRRRFSMADALYIGGVLNEAPEQYLRFSGGGIELVADLVTVPGVLSVGTGASGSFTSGTGQTITVRDGIITEIV